MCVGVVGFYFLLSDINSIISSTVGKEMQFSTKLDMLEKVNTSYQLTQATYREARQSLYRLSDRDEFDLKTFYSHFPFHLREDLKYHVYSRMLSQFPLFHKLDADQINRISDALQIETFEKCRRSRFGWGVSVGRCNRSNNR